MEWEQCLSIMGMFLGMFLWVRSESKAESIRHDQKLDDYRRENETRLEGFRQETLSIIRAIQEEIKDFHGRLCGIEERNSKKG